MKTNQNPLHRLALTIAAPIALMLLAVMACGGTGKPTVPLEESCRRAAAVLVVEPAADPGTYRVREVLHDGTAAGLRKDAILAIDLGGMVYEKGRAYILFLEPAAEAKRFRAVPQMRTEDGGETRERVRKLLAAAKAQRQGP